LSHPESSFVTEIEGIEGIWPEPPRWFSYSSFRDADECPRRWALSRASYPSVWDKPGYPQRANLASVVGDVVHGALEEVVRGLAEAGADSGASAAAVAVLRSIGGYSDVIERSITVRAEELEANPRMAPRLDTFIRELRSRLPEMRQSTQATLSRTRLVPSITRHTSDGEARGAIVDGSYPEYDIISSALGWIGRADLVTIEGQDVHILDYKTGAPSDHHADQLRTYALLWFRRDGADRSRPRATRLTLSYPSHDADMPAPSDAELAEFERDLLARSADLRSQVEHDRPARPSPENCCFCSVRHLCDVYWRTVPPASDGSTDAEVTIKARNGPRSFRARLAHTNEEVLVRTGEDASLPTSSRWRILNGYGVRGDEGDLRISVTASSELYRLRST
jgi:hypothetical protein